MTRQYHTCVHASAMIIIIVQPDKVMGTSSGTKTSQLMPTDYTDYTILAAKPKSLKATLNAHTKVQQVKFPLRTSKRTYTHA